MYRIAHGSTHGLADVRAFIEKLALLDQHPTKAARALFDPNRELFIARAPGRLDVIGGIADYSGSLVLELPIEEATLVALQKDDARVLKILSLGAEENNRASFFEMPLEDFERDGAPVSYDEARARFRVDERHAWAAYVAGAFLLLMRERGFSFKHGARLLIDSLVPEGKGVSSSAALEVAVMSAVVAAFDISLQPQELALLCQKVENLVVGAPCGVMDQMTVTCGQANQLLALLCQPAQLQGTRRIPEEMTVWGIDSGVRHSVGGGDYGSVRTGAFMGYRIIADLAGLEVEATATKGFVRVQDVKWGGYLANVKPDEFEERYLSRLPERLGGELFLSRYQGITDGVTRVQPERSYPVRASTAHPIYEHARVRQFDKLLSESPTEQSLTMLGRLLYESHASYSSCRLGSPGTDLLVQLVREAGVALGLYGAKITGGGSGGTVAVLGRRNADAALEWVAEEYERRTNYRPYIFSGSSTGAAEFGFLKLLRAE